jgi:carbon storage regulator
MLVIARKENEAVVAGDIEITVLSIRGSQVRLGITAPADVVVSRKELNDPGRPRGRSSFNRGNR